ncbi:MAG: WD40 repeat domain-containing protein [Gemmataceae bacterium]
MDSQPRPQSLHLGSIGFPSEDHEMKWKCLLLLSLICAPPFRGRAQAQDALPPRTPGSRVSALQPRAVIAPNALPVRVSSMRFSPDGKMLAFGAGEGVVKLWDLTTQQVMTLRGFSGVLNFNADGKTLVMSGLDSTVILWDVPNCRERSRSKEGRVLKFLGFLPDGKALACSTKNNKLFLWDVATGEHLGSFQSVGGEPPGAGGGTMLSPDSKLLAYLGREGEVVVWDLVAGRTKCRLTGHKNPTSIRGFAPDGRTILTDSPPGEMRLWDVASGRKLATIPHGFHWLFTRDSKTLAVAPIGGAKVTLWDVGTGHKRAAFEARAVSGISLAPNDRPISLAPNDRLLAVASGDTVELWDIDTQQRRATFRACQGPDDKVTAATFTPDGKTLIAKSCQGDLRLLDVATGKERATLVKKGRNWVSPVTVLSPDGRVLALGKEDTVRLWDVATARQLAVFQEPTIISGCVSPSGITLATGCADATIRLWEVSTARERRILRGHASPVKFVAFGPDDKVLVSQERDGTVKLWDVPTGKEKASLDLPAYRVRFLTFLRDGSPVACELTGRPPDTVVKLWDMATLKERGRFAATHTDPDSIVGLSPDENTLVLKHSKNIGSTTVVVIDARTGKERAALETPSSTAILGPHPVILLPDGQTLVCGGPPAVYDVSTLKKRCVLKEGPRPAGILACSPDGKMLALVEGHSGFWSGPPRKDGIELWEIATGKKRTTIPGLDALVVFAPDGKSLVKVAYRCVEVYDTSTGDRRAELPASREWTALPVFTPDGKTLITFDGTARLWDTASWSGNKGNRP